MSAPTPTAASTTGPSASHPSGRPRRLVPILTGVASLAFAVVTSIWMTVPSTNAFADPDSWLARDSALLLPAMTPTTAAQVLLAMSLVGVAVAAVAIVARDRAIRSANNVVAGFGVLYALVVGVGMLSEVAITTAGYLMALIVAVGAVVLAVNVVRTSPASRWVVAAVAASLVAVFASGLLPVSALRRLGGRIVDLFGEAVSIVGVLGLVVAVLLWALTAGLAMKDSGALDGLGQWVLAHRRAITILAALGPVPYALVRLTWFTPWPQFATGETLAVDVRIWGLLLSFGAWAGMILTIGLIRPWGQIFPRWMPWVAGRPVPVWFAAGPGAVVAAILIVSAVPMIRMFAEQSLGEALLSALVFPLWIWGPALALAVWGYVLHRRAV